VTALDRAGFDPSGGGAGPGQFSVIFKNIVEIYKMATRTARLLSTALVSLLLGACATGFQAGYDYDRSHDFSNFQSWAWISEHPMTIGRLDNMPNPLLEPRIMSAIEDNLTVKGYTRVDDPASADFVVAFTVGSRDKIRVNTYQTYYGGYGYPGRWGGPYYGMGVGTETRVREYTEGMIAVDIFDVADQVPVWHGVAEKSISSSDRKNIEATIDAAVTAVLGGFPPG
jgi:hypothetical protein